jgi:transcriptional enhancer factor
VYLPQRGHNYSPKRDYTYYHHNYIVQTTRRPLDKSTDNSQPYDLGSLTLCQSSHILPSSSFLSILKPPMVLTQAMTSTYGTSLRNRRSYPLDTLTHESSMTRSTGGTNPIYSWKYFAEYSAKALQKPSPNHPSLQATAREG